MRASTLAVLLMLAFHAGCTAEKKAAASVAAETKQAPANNNPENVILEPNAPQLKMLKIEQARTEDVETDEVSAPGNLETNPNRVTHVTLPVTGRIASVNVKLGDSVHEGQTLVTVESQEIDSAELAYRQAETTLSQARATENKSQADLDRLTDLFAHQAVAQKEVLAAQNALTLAKNSVMAAEAALQQTRRRLEMLGLKPGTFGQRLSIPAPLTGKVLALNVVAGEFRNDLSAPLLTVADLRTLWVSTNVPETYIRHCRIGGAVQIELVAFPGEVFRARVSHIADTVDPETRTIKVRAELDNSSGRFRPEMYGRIKYGQATEKRVVIPETGVVQSEGKPAAYVEEKPGHFARRYITVDKQQGGRLVVRDGIKAGERVVIAGAIYLKGGI